MKYPFRYDKPKIGDLCWFLSQEGIVESKIVNIHDHYYNLDPAIHNRGNQENYLIDYWIDTYPYHGLIFGIDLFETEKEALKFLEKEKNE